MTYRILAAAALTLGLGTAAIAQSTDGAGSPSAPMPMPETAISTFFTEPFDGSVVSDAIKAERWAAMSAEQQEAAKAECDRFASDGMSDDMMMDDSSKNTYEASVTALCEWIATL